MKNNLKLQLINGTKMPKISFVMPAHNRDDLIKESVQSILDQTEKDWELIIVDDHSDADDKTEEIIKFFNDARIKYFKLPDMSGRGVSCARNYGNAMAQSKIIAVCDSDDIYLPARTKLILDSFEREKWDIFYGKYLTFKEGQEAKEDEGNKQIPFDLAEFKKKDFIPNGSSAYTKKIAAHYPYNSFLNSSEDYDFFSRAAIDGKKFYFCDQYIFKYRVHANSISAGTSNKEFDSFVKENRGWETK